jgi:hypothetical protein
MESRKSKPPRRFAGGVMLVRAVKAGGIAWPVMQKLTGSGVYSGCLFHVAQFLKEHSAKH